MLHPYHVEPIRPAIILIGIVVSLALIMPTPNARVLTLVLLTGPLAWGVLQMARRGRGVITKSDRLELQSGVWRRSMTVALDKLQAWDIQPGGQLALAYLQIRHSETPQEEARPPHLRLHITAPLADPDSLKTALPLVNGLSMAQLHSLILWRRIRRFIFLLFGLLLGIPALVIVGARLAGIVTNVLGAR